MLISPSNKAVLDKRQYEIMMDFAKENPYNEVLGVFFGIINENGDIFINKAYKFRIGDKTEVEFIDEDYVKLVPIIRENEETGLKWLGWFHSHPFRPGDHVYMSRKDRIHHKIAQQQNPFWTAIVLNPHQIEDPKTNKGARAFRLSTKLFSNKISYKVKKLKLKII